MNYSELTSGQAIACLATDPLDPRDEGVCGLLEFTPDGTMSWSFEGRFLDGRGFRFAMPSSGPWRRVAALIRENRRTAPYREERAKLLNDLPRWLEIGRGNPWINAVDPPFTADSFTLCRNPAQMARLIDRNNWGLGSAFVLAERGVVMIQQVEGPGEFLMIRDGVAFDSWTTGSSGVTGARLISSIDAVADAPLDERGRPCWYEQVDHPDPEPGVIAVAESVAHLSRLLGEPACSEGG